MTTAPRRPGIRLTIGATMLLVAGAALVFLLAAGINPFRSDPDAAALQSVAEWCSREAEDFGAKARLERTSRGRSSVADEAAPGSPPCLVKLARAQKARWTRDGWGCERDHCAIAPDGRVSIRCDIANWSVQGGEWSIPPGDLAEILALVAKLPGSGGRIAPGDAIVVGFSRNGAWLTRSYDRGRLPPEVAELITRAGLGLWSD